MRQFRVQRIVKLKVQNFIKTTPKAYLVQISPGVSIWVSKYMVKNIPIKNMLNLYEKYAYDIKLQIRAEEMANKKEDKPMYRRRKNKDDEWRTI
jgi:hypothetical protein